MATGSYPFWTTDELAERRLRARAEFKARWTPVAQQAAFEDLQDECAEEIGALLEASENLLALKRDPAFFSRGPKSAMRKLVDPARFMTRPFLSSDNLEVLAEGRNLADVVVDFINPLRFPWLANERQPTEAELVRAVEATAELMALQRSSTAARVAAAKRQEAAARAALTGPGAGLAFVPTKDLRRRAKALPAYAAARGIEAHNLRDLLAPGEFTSEFNVAGAKCDLPILLPSGLLIASVGEPVVPPRAPSFAAAIQPPQQASRRAKPGSGVGRQRTLARENVSQRHEFAGSRRSTTKSGRGGCARRHGRAPR